MADPELKIKILDLPEIKVMLEEFQTLFMDIAKCLNDLSFTSSELAKAVYGHAQFAAQRQAVIDALERHAPLLGSCAKEGGITNELA